MKHLLILTLIFLTISSGIAQIADYGKLNQKAEYNNYLTKSGEYLSVGDTLIIGTPRSDLGFIYISQANQRVSVILAGKQVVVTKLKTYGSKSRGYKMYAHFGGYGLYPVLIDYETALEVGEIKNPKTGITREDAIKKLQEAKQLLDLQVISQEEYDSLKTKLSIIIRN